MSVSQLPAGVGAALEADANAVDGGGEGQRCGKRGSRAIEAEEAHAGCLQRRQRNPRHEGPAAQSRRIASPAGPTCGTLVGD
jgi:hypothetical protein